MHKYAKNEHVLTKYEHSKTVAQNEPGCEMVRGQEEVDHYSSASVPFVDRTDSGNFLVFGVGGEARARGLALSVLGPMGLGTVPRIGMAVELEVVEEVVGRTCILGEVEDAGMSLVAVEEDRTNEVEVDLEGILVMGHKTCLDDEHEEVLGYGEVQEDLMWEPRLVNSS
jgi:hypothetical protein